MKRVIIASNVTDSEIEGAVYAYLEKRVGEEYPLSLFEDDMVMWCVDDAVYYGNPDEIIAKTIADAKEAGELFALDEIADYVYDNMNREYDDPDDFVIQTLEKYGKADQIPDSYFEEEM